MNPVDDWWNRNFPPYSLARLAFMLAWVPVFSGLTLWVTASLIGIGFSWLLVVYLSLATGLMIAIGWMVAARKAEPSAGPEVAPSAPQDARAKVPRGGVARSQARPDWRIDFALATGIFFIGLTIALLVMGLDASIEQLVINLFVALAFGFTLSSRFSLASLVVLSLLIGLGGGLLMQIFFLVLSGQDDFFLYWAMASLVAFAFGYPLWQQMQRSRERWEAIPSWAIATGTVCLLMITAAISEVL